MKDEANLTVHVGSGGQITTNVEPKSKLEVIIGDAAKMDCQKAINYIKSGTAEIEQAVQEGIEDFNENAVSKTGDFNTNAVNKTNAFNQNAEEKQALIDEAAAEAKEWAIGSPEEPEEGSAKYWANQASSELSTLESDVSAIQAVIPAQASATNQLADKSFVNSSIATNTANFIGTFNSVAELEAYSGTLTNNDYAFVQTTDTAGNTLYDRYKWNGSEWLFEYELNNSSFTAAQWAAINSGATAQKLANYVTTNTAQTITSSKTFTSEQKFKQPSNTTTNGLSIVSYTSGTADIGLRDTSNNWLGRLFFNSSGILQLSGTSATSPTPTDNNTTSRQIDTVGARNTKLQSYVSLAGTETISGDKSFTGTVTAVTQTAGDNSTKVATTAYVDSVAGAVHIVETWHNGTEWGRVWSDKFCEQGGTVGTGTTSGYPSYTITLTKEYADTNFNVQVTGRYTNSTNDGTNYCSARTTGSITIRSVGYGSDWVTRGYIS